MNDDEIRLIEKEIWEQTLRLEMLRKNKTATPIRNYKLDSYDGQTSLLQQFGYSDKLLVIHNMGENCRWCTAWADILNAVLPHLESECAVLLVSKDDPGVQRKLALSRNWKFRMASHKGKDYAEEQSIIIGQINSPGVVFYERRSDIIFRKNASSFYPGDMFNPIYHFMSVAGIGIKEFKPQFAYWNSSGRNDESMATFELSH